MDVIYLCVMYMKHTSSDYDYEYIVEYKLSMLCSVHSAGIMIIIYLLKIFDEIEIKFGF